MNHLKFVLALLRRCLSSLTLFFSPFLLSALVVCFFHSVLPHSSLNCHLLWQPQWAHPQAGLAWCDPIQLWNVHDASLRTSVDSKLVRERGKRKQRQCGADRTSDPCTCCCGVCFGFRVLLGQNPTLNIKIPPASIDYLLHCMRRLMPHF